MGMNSDLSTPPEYVVNHSGRALLGQLPLIRGEDGCAYNELCARIAAAVKPKDFIEEIWVRDVADLSWEVFRLRRIQREGVDIERGCCNSIHFARRVWGSAG